MVAFRHFTGIIRRLNFQILTWRLDINRSAES
jgi:hypothetical protein